jgi:ABC-type nitrate/sulfonate/bicarbonate transport system substrate-binding protein
MSAQIRIGTFTRSLLIQIAAVTGNLQRAGLEVKESLVSSSPVQFKSLEAGEFDLVMTSPDNALAYRFLSQNPLGRNLPVTILSAIDRGLGLSLCLSPELASVESVRGRVVGVDVPQSGFAFVAYALLEAAGIPPGEYRVDALGSTPRRTDALIAGSCAATVLNAGNELRAGGAGCIMVSRVTDLGPYLGTVLAAMTTRNPADEATRLRFADVLLETSQEIQGGQWESQVIEESMNLLDLTEHEALAHRAILLDPHNGFVSDGIVDRASISTLIELRRKYLPAAELDSILDSLDMLVINRALAEASGPINA